MNSSDWVAEHVMGFERAPCGPYPSGSFTLYEFQPGDYCERCGELRPIEDRDLRPDGGQKPCPKGSFPKFTLVDLMRKLGEKGYHVMVRVDPERENHRLTVMFINTRVGDTDNPLELLCHYLYSMRAVWEHSEEAHSASESEKKHFVSGEQVLEEYVPGYERPRRATDWPTREEEPSTAVCAYIRDAIKLLQKVVGQSKHDPFS